MRGEKEKKQAVFRGNGKHGGENSGLQRRPAGFAPPEQRKRINRPTATNRNMATQLAVNMGTDTGVKDPSPNQHSAKKVRKAIDFTMAVANLDEAGNRIDDISVEKVGENDVPVAEVSTAVVAIPIVPESGAKDEEEEGEVWWNEVIAEEETEKTEAAMADHASDINDMQIDESDNVGNHVDVEQYVDVEAKEVGQGKQMAERKMGTKKKVLKSTVGMGGVPLKRLVQGAKTPRRKGAAKENHRHGDKAGGKEPADPSEGSETFNKIG